MQITIMLNEQDLTEAVRLLLASRGMKLTGSVRFAHSQGDRPCDTVSTSAHATAELTQAGQR